MDEVFLSYRREDASGTTDRLRAELERRLCPRTVFKDDTSLEPGQEWPEHIDRALKNCRVLLAIIGPKWMETLKQRSQNPDQPDILQHEIATAFADGKPVIPVPVDGAKLPWLAGAETTEETPQHLQDFLAQFSELTTGELRIGRDFKPDFRRLFAQVRKHLPCRKVLACARLVLLLNFVLFSLALAAVLFLLRVWGAPLPVFVCWGIPAAALVAGLGFEFTYRGRLACSQLASWFTTFELLVAIVLVLGGLWYLVTQRAALVRLNLGRMTDVMVNASEAELHISINDKALEPLKLYDGRPLLLARIPTRVPPQATAAFEQELQADAHFTPQQKADLQALWQDPLEVNPGQRLQQNDKIKIDVRVGDVSYGVQEFELGKSDDLFEVFRYDP